MRRPLPPSLAALASTLVAAVALAVPGAVAAAPADPAAQTDTTVPAPTAATAPDPGADGPTQSTITGGEVVVDETATAQEQADEDLQAVWIVVYALAAVALGLLVLLVVYVRATNPARTAARRQQRLVAARARAREQAGLPPEDPELAAAAVAARVARDDDRSAPATAAASTPRGATGDEGAEDGWRGQRRRRAEPAPVLSLPGLADDEASMPPTEGAPGAPAPPAATTAAGVVAVRAGATEARAGRRAPVPDAATVPSVGPLAPPRPPDAPVRTLRSQVPPPPPPPRRAEGTRPPAEDDEEPTSDHPVPSDEERTDAAFGPDLPPAVLSRQDDRDGSEGVKLITEPGAAAPTEVRPASGPRRPRRVEAPAKKLGTPDAERILVRPGQAPVRVPIRPKPVEAAAGPRPDRPEGEADGADDPGPAPAEPSSEAGDER